MFLDHPYCGVDNKWVAISGRKFPAAGGFDGPILFILDKASLLAGTAIAFGTNAQTLEKSGLTRMLSACNSLRTYRTGNYHLYSWCLEWCCLNDQVEHYYR